MTPLQDADKMPWGKFKNTPMQDVPADYLHSMKPLVRRAVQEHTMLSASEKAAIERALDAGAQYGYGNVMAWLATEWACSLRDDWGLPEKVAIEAVSGRGPYPLPSTARHPDCQLHVGPFFQCCCTCQHHLPAMHHCTTSPEMREKHGGCCCRVQKGWACVAPGMGCVHDNWPEHSCGCELHTPNVPVRRGTPSPPVDGSTGGAS